MFFFLGGGGGGGMLLMAPGSASLVQRSVNYPFSLLHKVHPLTHQPMSFKLDDWQPWAASGGEAGSVGEVIKCYQSRFVVWWLKSTVCLQACWDLQPFALSLPAFVLFLAVFFSPSSLSLSLSGCVEYCVHGGHFPAHCDDIDCRASPDCSPEVLTSQLS